MRLLRSVQNFAREKLKEMDSTFREKLARRYTKFYSRNRGPKRVVNGIEDQLNVVAACRIALKYEWVDALVDCMHALQGHMLYGLTGEDAQTFYQEIFDFLQERAPRVALDVKGAAAAAYARHDEHEACLATHQFVLHAARDLGFEGIEGSALRGVGHQYLNQCRLEEALESFTRALAIGEQTRNVRLQGYSLCGLARVSKS